MVVFSVLVTIHWNSQPLITKYIIHATQGPISIPSITKSKNLKIHQISSSLDFPEPTILCSRINQARPA